MKTRLNAQWLLVILLYSSFILHPSAFSADVPPIINYQGLLTDNLGNAVTAGYYEIEFRVWDSPNLTGAGHLIWGRSFPLHVMSNGTFNILLSNDGGAITNPVSPVTNDLRGSFESTDRYLGLTITHNPLGAVGSPAEISPRQRLVSAPFAFHAQHATETPGTIPIGGIIAWSGAVTNVPDSWALCDGGTYSGQVTPDLRNRFILGAGGVYARGDAGGTNQVTLTIDEIPSHSHGGIRDKGENSAYHATETGGYFWKHDNWKNTDNTGGGHPHENMPPYYALCYIMRVR
ncbi:MAG TPA: tail fiber protein [Kiritimatiellia bacterium]|nr:tail fiber protein [Kiritimatiellia bacterium]HRZ13413.1 tail fiber protein [Kiritimatiellia bacterium]HSA18947.1 tail fiber protein [Kiritimatiellia bacterium]